MTQTYRKAIGQEMPIYYNPRRTLFTPSENVVTIGGVNTQFFNEEQRPQQLKHKRTPREETVNVTFSPTHLHHSTSV